MKPHKTLYPLAVLYDGVTSLRNLLYDTRLLASERFDLPVICIGNLAAGGTGKTPHVEYILRLLKDRLAVAVLSRGYRRDSRGFLVYAPGMDAGRVGDEPLQLATKFPECVVAVGERRREAIHALRRRFPGLECIVLDDGLQHRAVRPGLSVLLTDYSRPFTRDFVLPAGMLRESARGARRADVIVVTKCPPGLDAAGRVDLAAEIAPRPGQQLFFSRLAYPPPQPVSGPALPDVAAGGCAVLAFSGVASPDAFTAAARERFRQVTHLAFPDHHAFSDDDLRRIVAEFDNIAADRKIMLTTEKDYARIVRHPLLQGLPLYVQPVTVEFDGADGPRFDQTVTAYAGIAS